MGKFVDLTGQKFGRLTVIRRVENYISPKGKPCVVWECVCDCGNVVKVLRQSLVSENTCSCGCLQKECVSAAIKTHGKSQTRLYHVWEDIKARCYNPRSQYFHIYGAKGVALCEEWHDYDAFEKWAFANGYNEKASRGECTLDRIDGNGNYEPMNCRWTTSKEQSNNTSRNRLITYDGRTQTIAQWSEEFCIPYNKLLWRINHSWDLKRAFYTP